MKLEQPSSFEHTEKQKMNFKVNRYDKRRLRGKINKINEELKASGLMLDSVNLTRLNENKKNFVLHFKV